jgi:chromosome transmission fidelity protein 1
MLLSKSTRESVGIKLEGNIVIFDEAHNLIDAVNQTHSALVSRAQV